jgi:hypothetical protein
MIVATDSYPGCEVLRTDVVIVVTAEDRARRRRQLEAIKELFERIYGHSVYEPSLEQVGGA